MMRGLVAVVVMLAMVAFGCGEKTSEGTSSVIDSMAQLPGYSAEGAQSGQVLSLRAHLPWWQYRQAKTGLT